MHVNWLAIIGLAWIPVVLVISIYLLLKRTNLLNSVSVVKVAAVLIGGAAAASSILTVKQFAFAKNVYLTIYARQFWPETPKWINHTSNATAQVTGGGFTKADVFVDGLGAFARTMLALNSVAFATVVILACWQAYAIAREIQKGQEFKQHLSRRFAWSGIAIIVVGMLGQVANLLGTNYAAIDIFGSMSGFGWQQAADGTGAGLVPNPFVSANGMDISDHLVVGVVQSGPGVGLEFWPIAVGLVLLVLARVFKRGQELVAETEGLI